MLGRWEGPKGEEGIQYRRVIFGMDESGVCEEMDGGKEGITDTKGWDVRKAEKYWREWSVECGSDRRREGMDGTDGTYSRDGKDE